MQNIGGTKIMIVSKNTHPNRQLYYLGAKTLDILSSKSELVNFFDAYEKLKHEEDISVSLFVLTLDWLYLLGAIESENGWIRKCS